MVKLVGGNQGPNVQIGDYVPKAGIYTKPGVVTEKKEDGTVVIDTDPENIKKYHRHSNTNGLTPEEKEKFNSIMDDVMNLQEFGDRINQVQSQIDALKVDPKNKKLVDSLRNEQAQLIRHSRELPRVYNYETKDLGY